MVKERKSTGTRSGMLERVMDILSAFRPSDTELSPTTLAQRVDLPKATVHRIVKEMLDLGLLEKGTEGVLLGLKMFEIGQMVPRQRSLRRAALPLMNDLREATKATVHLAVLEDTDVVYLEILASSVDDIPSRTGGRMPSYATGIGKAMLAHAPKHVQEKVFNGKFHRLGPGTITNAAELEEELKSTLEWGFAYDREESSPGIVCAAAPVLGLDGTLIGGLSVSSRIGEINLQRTAPAVHTAALTLGRLMDGLMNLSVADHLYEDFDLRKNR